MIPDYTGGIRLTHGEVTLIVLGAFPLIVGFFSAGWWYLMKQLNYLSDKIDDLKVIVLQQNGRISALESQLEGHRDWSIEARDSLSRRLLLLEEGRRG